MDRSERRGKQSPTKVAPKASDADTSPHKFEVLETSLTNEQETKNDKEEQEMHPFSSTKGMTAKTKSRKKTKRTTLSEQDQALESEAKEFLRKNNLDYEKLQGQPFYSQALESKILQANLKKFILNQRRKSPEKTPSKSSYQLHSEASMEAPLSPESSRVIGDAAIKEIKTSHFLGLQMLAMDEGSGVNHEIVNSYLNQYLSTEPSQRESFFERILSRNPSTLIDCLNQLQQASFRFDNGGIFSIINRIVSRAVLEEQTYIGIFACSLAFYSGESFSIEPKTLGATLGYLAAIPNSDQVLGLATIFFFNSEVELLDYENDLIRTDQANIGIIPRMAPTFHKFQVDTQIQALLPNTLLILNQPFISLLKVNHGMNLIREINSSCFHSVVKIAALLKAPCFESLDSTITKMRKLLIHNWALVDRLLTQHFLRSLAIQLQKRNQVWLSNPELLTRTTQLFMEVQAIKGIRLSQDIIDQLTEGDLTVLSSYDEVPMSLESNVTLNYAHLLDLLQKKNSKNQDIQIFTQERRQSESCFVNQIHLIEQRLGYKLFTIQRLCLEYLLQDVRKVSLIQFGIGNGKTLLCALYGVFLAQRLQQPIFILSKFDHLILRDYKKFKKLINEERLASNYNQASQEVGVYYFSEKAFWKLIKNDKSPITIDNAVVLMDEFDWYLFEGSIETIETKVLSASRFKRLLLISGSKSTLEEQEIILKAFKASPIIFPTIQQVEGNRCRHLMDQLVTTSNMDFLRTLGNTLDKNLKKSPTVIVAGQSYNLYENTLTQISPLRFYSLRSRSAEVIESLLDQGFHKKDSEEKYGVYLLTEAQGRGTDLKSSKDIEDAGGIYLIVGDVFPTSIHEQVIGRVGRMGKKGKWQYLLFEEGSQEEITALIQNKRQIYDNQQLIKFGKVLSKVNEPRQAGNPAEEEKLCSLQYQLPNSIPQIAPSSLDANKTVATLVDEAHSTRKQSNILHKLLDIVDPPGKKIFKRKPRVDIKEIFTNVIQEQEDSRAPTEKQTIASTSQAVNAPKESPSSLENQSRQLQNFHESEESARKDGSNFQQFSYSLVTLIEEIWETAARNGEKVSRNQRRRTTAAMGLDLDSGD